MTGKVKGLAVGGAILLGLLAVFLVWQQPSRQIRSPSPSVSGAQKERLPGLAGSRQGHAESYVEGSVSGPAGRALGAATVVVHDQSRVGVDRLPALRGAVETDGAGRFRLGPLERGRYRVTAASRDHLPASRELTLPEGETVRGFDLQLETGGLVLHGRVLDAGAGAIAGARVRAHLHGDTTTPAVVLARTDRLGEYRIALPRGFHWLVADAGGYAPARTGVWLVGEMARDFRLIPAAGITGRVVHKGTATPVADARVLAEGRGPPVEVDSDAEGAFQLNTLEPGNYLLLARAGPLVGRVPVPITTRLGTRVEGVLIEVEPGRSVAGQVRRIGGRPVAGARVHVLADGLTRAEGATDGQGAFRVEGLLAGPHLIEATAPDLLTVRRNIAVADQDLAGIVFELGEAAQVRGRVIDSQDRPCPGATIYVQSDDEEMIKSGRQHTDDDGRFVVAHLPPVELDLRAEGGPRGRARIGLGKLSPGERREITVRLSSAGPHVRGTLRWKEGSPAAGIEIMASNLRADQGAEQTTSGPDGTYQLGPFADGGLLLVQATSPFATATDPANGRRTVPLAGGQDVTGVDFRFARSEATIRGVVLGPDGRPLAGAVVAIERSAATRVVTDPDGAFVLEGLAPDTHAITAEYPGLPGEQREVAAGRQDVRIQLRRGSLLAGVVDGIGGRGAGLCWVWARSTNDQTEDGQPARSVCAAAGAFELRGLRPGGYDLFATAIDGRSGGLANIQLSEGQERRGLQVRVGDGLTVIGSVVDLESRKPIASARIRARLEPTSLEVLADAAGRFRIEGVPRGDDINLEVEAPGFMPNRQTRPSPARGDSLDFGALPLLTERPGPPGTGRAGLIVTIGKDGRISVQGTVDDLPAARAGIVKGDVVVAIDGHDVANADLAMAVALIRGPTGAPLTLQLRGLDNRVRTVRIVRG